MVVRLAAGRLRYPHCAVTNPLRAKMVEKAEAWPWSSFGRGTAKDYN
jgi:hypothetical protein